MHPASETGERIEAIGTGAPSSSTRSALYKGRENRIMRLRELKEELKS